MVGSGTGNLRAHRRAARALRMLTIVAGTWEEKEGAVPPSTDIAPLLDAPTTEAG
jgi:hypothetical protein